MSTNIRPIIWPTYSVQVNLTTSVVYVTPLILNYLLEFYTVPAIMCRVLQALLAPPADHNYSLRDRPHNRQLPDRMSHLTNCNFIVWMLFCDSYFIDSLSCILSFPVYNCGLTKLLFYYMKETFDLIWLICRDWLTGQPTDCCFVMIGRPRRPTILCCSIVKNRSSWSAVFVGSYWCLQLFSFTGLASAVSSGWVHVSIRKKINAS